MKRMPAFTITDVIVTMIISMLAIGIAFAVFRFTYNQLYYYNEVNDDYKELYLLYSVMEEDFRRATEARFRNDELRLLLPAHKKYLYTLSADKIVRTTDILSDTFHIRVQNITPKLDNILQTEGLIDELEFTLMKEKIALPYKFIKEYASEIRMALEENNSLY